MSIRLSVEVCNEIDYSGFAEKFQKEVHAHSNKPRVIDITPGRKFASAIGLKVGISENVESRFYLHLLDDAYTNRNYPLIPEAFVKFVDFKRGVTT
ncbi:MAG: hypothetical protein K9W43_12305 [Candidatus Thorarchaeota archaeon]|nr:hypothetical protein [Candidatus Thorarchaeota archaeon]